MVAGLHLRLTSLVQIQMSALWLYAQVLVNNAGIYGKGV